MPSGKAMVTIRDVAASAGVSIATVSKALNGRQHVRAETRMRVQEVAAELGFSPNASARSLVAGRTGTVGLITNDLEGRFSIPVLLGAEDAFGAGSASVFLCDARGDAIRERHHLQALLSRRVDGIIVVGDRTDPRPSLGTGVAVPVVYAYAPSTDPSDVSVVTDNTDAGRLAAEHLLLLGKQHIAYVSGDSSYAAARDRVQGARGALTGAGLDFVSGAPLFGTWSEIWGRGATTMLLDRYPEVDAVLAGSDQIARGVLDVLRDAGLSVPHDVAVMGHDNQEQIATQARPPLSSIDMNLDQIGRRAAELLFDAIDGHKQPGIHSLPCRLLPRSSTTTTD